MQISARFLGAADIRERELPILGDLVELLAAAHDASPKSDDEHQRHADQNERHDERDRVFGQAAWAFDFDPRTAR